MKQRKKWDSQTKWLIVLSGLKGKPVSEICNEHGVAQSQYYKWRDQVLSESPKLFDLPKKAQREQHLESENKKLKRVIGELTYELKKNDDLLDY